MPKQSINSKFSIAAFILTLLPLLWTIISLYIYFPNNRALSISIWVYGYYISYLIGICGALLAVVSLFDRNKSKKFAYIALIILGTAFFIDRQGGLPYIGEKYEEIRYRNIPKEVQQVKLQTLNCKTQHINFPSLKEAYSNRDEICYLHIYGSNKLTSLPAQLYEFKKLTHLNISPDNHIPEGELEQLMKAIPGLKITHDHPRAGFDNL